MCPRNKNIFLPLIRCTSPKYLPTYLHHEGFYIIGLFLHTKCAFPTYTMCDRLWPQNSLIFYVCEGSSQPIANQLNMQKIMVSIFLTNKATIFDTHSMYRAFQAFGKLNCIMEVVFRLEPILDNAPN